jgi:hypothetical protein
MYRKHPLFSNVVIAILSIESLVIFLLTYMLLQDGEHTKVYFPGVVVLFAARILLCLLLNLENVSD